MLIWLILGILTNFTASMGHCCLRIMIFCNPHSSKLINCWYICIQRWLLRLIPFLSILLCTSVSSYNYIFFFTSFVMLTRSGIIIWLRRRSIIVLIWSTRCNWTSWSCLISRRPSTRVMRRLHLLHFDLFDVLLYLRALFTFWILPTMSFILVTINIRIKLITFDKSINQPWFSNTLISDNYNLEFRPFKLIICFLWFPDLSYFAICKFILLHWIIRVKCHLFLIILL